MTFLEVPAWYLGHLDAVRAGVAPDVMQRSELHAGTTRARVVGAIDRYEHQP
jgi:hypothetical protein